jgi:hypothetical protein
MSPNENTAKRFPNKAQGRRSTGAPWVVFERKRVNPEGVAEMLKAGSTFPGRY